MNHQAERLVLKVRRYIQPGEWHAKLLGLSRSQGTAVAPGLVLIQIDGFSKKEFERAIECNEMPFLKQLLTKEHYRLYPHYPGLPSATPAVQGQLFYGTEHCVPAFFFFDRFAHKHMQMSSGEDVEDVEQALAAKHKGLLEGGSSYSNIFTGGSSESHFCAYSLGWNKVWKDVNPINMVLLFVTHAIAFVRMVFLTALELVLAALDFIYGLTKGENIHVEARFILIRTSICVLLRELVTVGARIDLARGLPIVHLNFLGYDELAHRRGPSSKAAHWSLRGIDRCIRRIYKTALQATRRHYEVWVYSDHGQESTEPYPPVHGCSVDQAIKEVYGRLAGQTQIQPQPGQMPPQNIGHRVRYLGHGFQRLYKEDQVTPAPEKDLTIVAKGGIGHVYVFNPLSFDQKRIFAQEIIRSAHVPLVLASYGQDKAVAWNSHGEYILPEQAAEVLGAQHPYLGPVSQDLINVCHHPKAGDLIISGLGPDGKYQNFVFEHGDHGGPGKNETDAFALLPAGIRIGSKDDGFIRTRDLRQSALHALGASAPTSSVPGTNGPLAVKETIRIMTYNVHSCIGMDGKVSAERVARVISRYEPDIIALQELDLSRPKSGAEDQPHIIARHLEMLYHFHPSMHIEEQQFGNAVLSRFPMRVKKADMLPAISRGKLLEPRGALWTEIDINGYKLQLIGTHLSVFHYEALQQAKALIGKQWVLHPHCQGPVILCGDFNALPGSPVYRTIKRSLRDVQREVKDHRPKPTWFSHYPVGRIDHIFVSQDVHVSRVLVPESEFNKMVSDHLPLIVDIGLKAS